MISFNRVLRNLDYPLLCRLYFSIQGIFFATPKENEVAISRKQLRAEKGGTCCLIKVPLGGATDLYSVRGVSPAKSATAAAADPSVSPVALSVTHTADPC